MAILLTKTDVTSFHPSYTASMGQTRYKWLFTFFLLSTGCAPHPSEYHQIDSDLLPYYSAFKAEAEARGINLDVSHLKIHLDDSLTGSNKAGSCSIGTTKSGDFWRQTQTTHLNISINPDKFRKFDHYRRVELLFHELGHCLLGLSHNDNRITALTSEGLRNLPASWMSSYQGGYYLTESEKNLLLGYYIHQLFNPETEYMDLTTKANIRSFDTTFSLQAFDLF